MTKIIVYNLEYGTNVSSMKQYLNPFRHLVEEKQLISKIIFDLKKNDPDILGILEIDNGSMRAKLKSQILRLALNLGFNELHYDCKYVKKYLGKVPILKHQYNAIFSKDKLINKQIHFFEKGMKKAVLIARDKNYVYFLVHLSLNKKTRTSQLEQLVPLINSQKKKVILMGDFNCEPSSAELRMILEKTNLKMSNDFPTFPQWSPSKKLDYILIDNSIKVISSEVLKLPHSDHLPLYIELNP